MYRHRMNSNIEVGILDNNFKLTEQKFRQTLLRNLKTIFNARTIFVLPNNKTIKNHFN